MYLLDFTIQKYGHLTNNELQQQQWQQQQQLQPQQQQMYRNLICLAAS